MPVPRAQTVVPGRVPISVYLSLPALLEILLNTASIQPFTGVVRSVRNRLNWGFLTLIHAACCKEYKSVRESVNKHCQAQNISACARWLREAEVLVQPCANCTNGSGTLKYVGQLGALLWRGQKVSESGEMVSCVCCVGRRYATVRSVCVYVSVRRTSSADSRVGHKKPPR